MTLAQYLAAADLVVTGTVRSVEVVPIPEAEAPESLLGASYESVIVAVDSEVAGSTPLRTIEVRRLTSTPDFQITGNGYTRPLQVGQPYVFTLAKGGPFWDGAYVLSGEQAVATVQGEVATYPTGPAEIPGDDRQLTMDELNQSAS